MYYEEKCSRSKRKDVSIGALALADTRSQKCSPTRATIRDTSEPLTGFVTFNVYRESETDEVRVNALRKTV